MNIEQFVEILAKFRTQLDYIQENFKVHPTKCLINKTTYHHLVMLCGKIMFCDISEDYVVNYAKEFQQHKTLFNMRVVIGNEVEDNEVEVILPIKKLKNKI